MVSRIRELLRGAGYKVCTDVEPIAPPAAPSQPQGAVGGRVGGGGSDSPGPAGGAGGIMEAMAGAVHKAAVVLICMSQKYKDSPSCRAGELMINNKKKLSSNVNREECKIISTKY